MRARLATGMEMRANVGTASRAMRLAPPAPRDDLGSVAHAVQFYGDDTVLLDGLSRFIGSALEAGDAALVIATKAHREGLAERLQARGLDVALAASDGRYSAWDAAETLSRILLGGQPDAARFAELLGAASVQAAATAWSEPPRVAAFGEMVALLWAEGKIEAALRLEQLWNVLTHTHSVYLRCAYPMSLFCHTGDGERLEEICAEHSRVIPAESYTSLATDEERLRAIALLQQQGQALKTEIEERKRMERALRERNRELARAVAVRDEFLSVAAHELKTPVTGLRALTQLLLRDARRQREAAPGRLESVLEAIEAQTWKLNHLTARLLDTAQIEAGRLRVEPTRTDLVALVRSALAQQPGSASHTVVFDGPERLEALVDPVRFEQAIANLLDNALKFSPQGGIVTVELGQEDDGGFRLCVTDQGVGLPADQREQVFERFHQAHGEGHLSGMGLGLHITREIVQLHGGSVRHEEPEHRGSRFVVALPSSARATGPGTADYSKATTKPAGS